MPPRPRTSITSYFPIRLIVGAATEVISPYGVKRYPGEGLAARRPAVWSANPLLTELAYYMEDANALRVLPGQSMLKLSCKNFLASSRSGVAVSGVEFKYRI